MSAEFSLLNDILIVLAISVLVVFLCHFLRIPAVVGFLFSGVVAGPSVLGFVHESKEVALLAEIGVVLLLFTIGMELSFDSLRRSRRTLLLGGSIQVIGTILVVTAIGRGAGYPFNECLFFGFLVSLSSTAIVFKLLQDKREIDAPHGRASAAIAIYQDIMIVPMMLVTSMLANTGVSAESQLFSLVLKIIAILVALGILAKWVVPWLLYQVARTRIRELFLLSIVILCFVITWFTSAVGLSLSLGAFAAGLIISESPYSEQALGLVQSLRDLFVSFFFVTIGMLVDIRFVMENIASLVLLALIVILLKGAIATFAVRITGHTMRTALFTGAYLSQVGEFAFVLAAVGLTAGLLNEYSYQTFLAVSLLSMIGTPVLISVFPKLLKWRKIPQSAVEAPEGTEQIKDHLIVIGYGVNGRNLVKACKSAGIPYIILETNPDVLKQESDKGEPILFGDAAQEHVLHKAGVERARVAVVAISDPPSTRRAVAVIKGLNPSIKVIARTRYVQEMGPLFVRGADEVIPEEFEASVEILNHVLNAFLLPQNEVETLIDQVRSDSYQAFRTVHEVSNTISELTRSIADVEITSYRVMAGSVVDGKTIGEIHLRSQFGATALAIRRGKETVPNPGPETRLLVDDIVIAMTDQDTAKVTDLFRSQ